MRRTPMSMASPPIVGVPALWLCSVTMGLSLISAYFNAFFINRVKSAVDMNASKNMKISTGILLKIPPYNCFIGMNCIYGFKCNYL